MKILDKCRKIPINRNEKFWMDAVGFLGSISRASGYPDFLVSWTKEVVNILRDEKKVNVFLVMPEDGCWGIYITGKENYLFTYNDGLNIYIGYRLYKILKEKNAHNLLAGLLLHETALFIMRIRTEKKGGTVDINKNHGEAMRLERALVGSGKKGDTLLSDLYINLVSMELDRRKVTLDKEDLFVEGCAISGEEIIAEISSIRYPDESFILQLAPGQKKSLPYSGGNFSVQAEDFNDLFKLEPINFKDYCSLMKIMGNYFVEESIINGEGPFKELLMYVRRLDFSKESDNFLLRILWLFTQKFFNNKIPRAEFLYNIFLLIDEYITYFIMREIVKGKYWKVGKYVREYMDEIADIVYKTKIEELPSEFYLVKQDKEKIREWLLMWFSNINMGVVPSFLKWVEKVPGNITKYYKKITTASVVSDYTKDIYTELSLHEEVLGIIEAVGDLMNELRPYNGIKKGEDPRICELNMMRVHFWKDRNIFTRGEKAGIYSYDNVGHGLVEIIDVKEYSIVVFLSDSEVDIPLTGYIKKLEEEDLSLSVSLEAISRVKGGEGIIRRLSEVQPHSTMYERGATSLIPFNPLIANDESQCIAVNEGLGSEDITLIQGPPGTGKTTVIAEIVLQYLKMGKKVLLTSQTNNAVDNALKDIMKHRSVDMGVGRVASTQEKIVDSNIKDIWIKSSRELEEFEREYKYGFVIGATNVGTHTLRVMRGKEFSVLVMDEAGKANLVESILPILLIKEKGKLIIVGDHKQGTPFNYDEDIINLFIKREVELHPRLRIPKERGILLKGKLNQSLFERLIEGGYKSVLLKVNYRSSPSIVELVSKLFYNGQLIPAKPPEKARSVIILDTSKKAGASERKETEVVIEGESRGYKNIYEARIIVEELKELLRYRYIATGIKTRHVTGVTILAPYIYQVQEIRRQVSQGLSRVLPSTAIEDLLDNVITIDSFQGREDEITIISFTRSNENPSEVGFLSELNRINVALSRAKRKMVLIGDFQTLMNAKRGSNVTFIREIFRTIYNFR